VELADADFVAANELELGLDTPLSKGDNISVIYVPTGQVLTRESVR